MAGAGLSPLQTSCSTSVDAVRLLRVEDHVGQVAPGFVGDLVAVDADPLDDIDAVRGISLVVQAGRVVREGSRA